MKIKKIPLIFALITISLTACKKAVGPEGPTGPAGPEAKTFNFNLTFDPGETFESYSGITGYDSGDVILTFSKYEDLSGTSYWTQLPATDPLNIVNLTPEFSDVDGNMFINSLKADGSSGSPWVNSTTLSFKAVLIKSSGLIKHPNIDLTDLESIQKTFNIE